MSSVLDSASAMFLEGMRAAGGRPACEQTPDEFRAVVAMASAQCAAPPAAVGRVEDRRIPVEGGDIGVRIYTPRPPGTDATRPLVLHFHGGGFVAGDLDTHDSICRYYAAHADAIVIAVDYRRPPEHRFPAAVEDSYAALVWAAREAAALEGDAARLAVTGDSAGGNLSAVLCRLAKERGGPRIAFQALVYPAVDFHSDPASGFPSRAQFGNGDYFLSYRDMEYFRRHYLADPAAESSDLRVSPLNAADLSGLPPALVVTAGCDPLRDEGKAYADRLAAAGVLVEYRCFEGTIHACVSFAGVIPAGAEALAFIASRLRAALHR